MPESFFFGHSNSKVFPSFPSLTQWDPWTFQQLFCQHTFSWWNNCILNMQLPVNLFVKTYVQTTPNIFMEILPFQSGHLVLQVAKCCYSVTGLIQTCDRKPEGCSRTVTILLCIHRSAAQKSCFHDKPGSLLHKKFSPEASDVFWALIPNCKWRTWFSQRSVNNHRTMTEEAPHLFHYVSLGETEEPGKKRNWNNTGLSEIWEFLPGVPLPLLDGVSPT